MTQEVCIAFCPQESEGTHNRFASANPTCTRSPTYDFALQLPLQKIQDLIPCLQSLTVLSSLNYVHILFIILCFRVLHSCYSGPKKLLNWMKIFRYPV